MKSLLVRTNTRRPPEPGRATGRPARRRLAAILAAGWIGWGVGNGAEAPDSSADRSVGRALRVHDPSTVVRCGDEYWLFHTGNGVRSLRSKDRETWSEGPPVFTTAPAWTSQTVPANRGHFWAPDVIALRGRYLVYYSVSTWGKNTSAIGLASNATLNPDDPAYAWKDEGMVIQSRAEDRFNAIDPAVFLDPAGRLWLTFGSFWDGIRVVELDPATGQRLKPGSPQHALARHESIEAPSLHYREGYYYLFVNWGLCCRGTNSTYEIRVGRSREVTGPYLDREGLDMAAGGGSLLMGSCGTFIGPGHAAVYGEGEQSWLSCHFYDGTRRGRPTLALRPLNWSADGWPEVEPPETPGP